MCYLLDASTAAFGRRHLQDSSWLHLLLLLLVAVLLLLVVLAMLQRQQQQLLVCLAVLAAVATRATARRSAVWQLLLMESSWCQVGYYSDIRLGSRNHPAVAVLPHPQA
jgi:hypothetical protein